MKIISVILFISGTIFSQDIDWVNKTISIDGAGYGKNKLMAKRAAKTDARRNLIESLKEIRVDSKTTMRDLEIEEDLVVTQASGYIKQAWFDDNSIEYERDNTKWMCSIVITMPLLGEYSDVVLPKKTNKRFTSELATPEHKQTRTVDPPKAPYTGLVIDLKGKAVMPSMMPKIISEDGALLYGMSKVSRQYATNMGVVGYIKDLNNPQSATRIGNNPLIITGKDLTGANPCDALISNVDSDLVNSLDNSLLEQCRVAFLID